MVVCCCSTLPYMLVLFTVSLYSCLMKFVSDLIKQKEHHNYNTYFANLLQLKERSIIPNYLLSYRTVLLDLTLNREHYH